MKMYKRIFGVLLCLCMLLGAVSLASAEENGATTGGSQTGGSQTGEGHSHKLCEGTTCTDPAHRDENGENHGSVAFATKLYQENDKLYIGEREWEYDSSYDGYKLPAGTYYLGTDLTLNHRIRITNTKNVNVTLCLNGKTITCEEAGAAIKAPLNAPEVFTLCDCQPGSSVGKIIHATGVSGTGIGVDSQKEDKFIMYNGCITQNTGSGVYLYQNASFTMYGGSITQNGYNNTSQFSGYGGGVYVHTDATFTIYGGNITGNYADKNGGGVHVGSETANFTMYGGSITGNHTAGSGGGVNVNAGTITVGGDVNISGNWKGDAQSSASNNNANNVYLSEYGNNGSSDGPATIAIEEPLTGTGSIGITTKTSVATTPNASVKIAAGKGTHAITDADKGHFTPDTGYCEVQKKADGALYLTHVHSGGEANCESGKKCGGCGRVYTDKDTTNHTGTLGDWKTDNTYHWKVYNCCNTEYGKAQHTYDREVVNPIYLKTAATCKQYAVYYKSCVCGAKGTETFEDESGDYASHVYDDTTWGYKGETGHAHLCKTDGCNEHDTIVAHTGGTATCKTRATCTDCHQEYGTLDCTNHTGSLSTDWRGKDDNKHWQVWSCCGAQVSGTDEAHNGTKWTVGEVTTPATCMTAGVRTYTCEVCGKVKTEEISATGHDFTGDTYLSNGTQHWKKCKDCGFEDTAHPESHNVVTDEAKPATTTETGLTEGKHCDVCGKVLVAQEVTPKLTPRYYYNSTTTTTKDTTKKDNTKSPGTFDPGVGVYALTAVLSVTGMAWVGRKKH